MEKIDDLSPQTALPFNMATTEVNPTHGGNEGDDITRSAGTEPERGSPGVRISPPPEATIEDAEAKASRPEREERMTEDMAGLADVDPLEFPEEDEEDVFRLR